MKTGEKFQVRCHKALHVCINKNPGGKPGIARQDDRNEAEMQVGLLSPYISIAQVSFL